jgi:hypothetical protein
LLIRFWPVNEMTELVSGMPVPQFGDESSWVLAVPVFRFYLCKTYSLTTWDVVAYPQGYAYPRFKDNWYIDYVRNAQTMFDPRKCGSGLETQNRDVVVRCAEHATPSICKNWYLPRRQAAVARLIQFTCGLRPRSLYIYIYIFVYTLGPNGKAFILSQTCHQILSSEFKQTFALLRGARGS